MSIHVHWYLPTNGDSRDIVGSGDRSPGTLPEITDFRAPTVDYLGQVARSAEQLGYEAVLTPTGTWCEDAWIFTAALSQVTRRLKFLVAFRPGFVSPTLAAHQAATFQRVSGGRLMLNIVTGGDPVEQRRYGDHLDHDQRYQRTEEFLAVLRGVSGKQSPFSFSGEHYQIENAEIDFGSYALPPIFFGGASPAAERTAARQADVYLAWGEPPAQIAERLTRTAWSAAARAPPWSGATPRSPNGSRSTTRSASTTSSSPASRTWRRRTTSPRAPPPNSAGAACSRPPPGS
jgi:alkanesulfonate monooxygenase